MKYVSQILLSMLMLLAIASPAGNVLAQTPIATNAQAANSLPITPSENLRPEMAKIATSEKVKQLMLAKDYVTVQEIIDQLAAFPNLSSYESYVIGRLQVALGSATGNKSMLTKALPSVIDSGRLDPVHRKAFIQALAAELYIAKDYAGANKWYERLKKED